MTRKSSANCQSVNFAFSSKQNLSVFKKVSCACCSIEYLELECLEAFIVHGMHSKSRKIVLFKELCVVVVFLFIGYELKEYPR